MNGERETVEEERGRRVEAVLEELRAAVRQGLGERAGGGTATAEDLARIGELEARGHLVEPEAVSPRPLVGRLIVAVRRAIYAVALGWYARPLVEQQKERNRVEARLLLDLLVELRRAERRAERLERRLEALERRLDQEAGGE